MEPTFGNAFLFGFWMTGVLVIVMTSMLPVIVLAAAGPKAAFRSLPLAPLFGLKIGAYAILPALLGSALAWLTWPLL